MTPSDADRAAREPLNHSVDADGNHWDHGSTPSFGAYLRPPLHAMPHPPAEGSVHALCSGSGATALFRWVEGVWHVTGERMTRLAYSPAWLASRGWTYVRCVEEAVVPKKRTAKDAPADPVVEPLPSAD